MTPTLRSSLLSDEIRKAFIRRLPFSPSLRSRSGPSAAAPSSPSFAITTQKNTYTSRCTCTHASACLDPIDPTPRPSARRRHGLHSADEGLGARPAGGAAHGPGPAGRGRGAQPPPPRTARHLPRRARRHARSASLSLLVSLCCLVLILLTQFPPSPPLPNACALVRHLVGDHGSVCFFRYCAVDNDDDTSVRSMPSDAARPVRAVPEEGSRSRPHQGRSPLELGGQDGRSSAGPRAPSSRFFLVLLRAAQSDSASVGHYWCCCCCCGCQRCCCCIWRSCRWGPKGSSSRRNPKKARSPS